MNKNDFRHNSPGIKKNISNEKRSNEQQISSSEIKKKYIISKTISRENTSKKSESQRSYISAVINPANDTKYKNVAADKIVLSSDIKKKHLIHQHIKKSSTLKDSVNKDMKKSIPNTHYEDNIFGRIKEPVSFTQKRRFNTKTGKTEIIDAASYKDIADSDDLKDKDKNKSKSSNSYRKSESRSNIKRKIPKKNNHHFSNKMIDRIEKDQDYNNLDDLSVKSSLYMRKGFINSKATVINTKKAYYVVRNLTPERRNQIKAARLDQSSTNDITQKRRNVYKHYTVRNLLAEKVENHIIKNAQVNYNYTGDVSVESAKMAIEKTYDTARAVKSISSKMKTVNRVVKSSRIKRETSSQIKNTSDINNKQKSSIKQNMAKNKYIRDQKRYEAIKRSSSSSYTSSMNVISRFGKRISFNFSNPQLLKYAAVKILGPVVVLAMIFLFFGFINSGGTVTTSSYKIIGAEKKTIKEYKNYVSDLDDKLKEKIEQMKKSEASSYDEVVVDIYGDDGKINTSFKELLVLNTVYFEQDVTFGSDEITFIERYHSKMNKVTKKVESYKCSGCEKRYCDDDDCSGHRYCPGHKRLRIIVNCMSMEDIIDDIGFSDFQKEWARELMLWDLENMYPGEGFEVDGGISGLSGLTPVEIAQILSGLPETGVRRSEIINSAVSLVGKVPYFWGGKSSAGWNNKWNTPQMVTAPGVSESGTVIPYGLDCSGFVDWAYKTAGVGNVLSAGGTAYQWNQSYGINKRDALPGDLVFKNPPNSNGINHVGIYLGKDSSGRDRFVHCSYSDGVTIDSWSGFKYYRRVKVKLDE